MGPRAETQQSGTNARAANSLGLALAVAASKPGSGAAANAAAEYQQQSNSRVRARERVAAVSVYVVGSKDVFGWVLGPRATVRPKKGSIRLEQTLRPYDLKADLSIPGLWDTLELDVLTAYPPIESIAGGTLSMGG